MSTINRPSSGSRTLAFSVKRCFSRLRELADLRQSWIKAVSAVLIVFGSLGVALSMSLGSTALPAKSSLASCTAARDRIAKWWPDASAVPCVKAERLAKTAPTGSASSRSVRAKVTTPQLQPTTIEAPANDGDILTTGIAQSAVPGTVITALWTDLESSMYVQVQSGSETTDSTQGTIDIRVINPTGYVVNANGEPVPETNGTVDGYGGGEYVAPGSTGPVTITSISGTLTDGDMTIDFSYAGGSGSFNPATGDFSD